MSSRLRNRRSIRLRHYDYTLPGSYFVTICAQHRDPLFGEIVGGEMRLNDMGRIVAETWESLWVRYPYVRPDTYIVMPDHMHGLISMCDNEPVPVKGASRCAPTNTKPLGSLIGAFKTMSTARVNRLRNTPGVQLGNAITTNISGGTRRHWHVSVNTSSTTPANGNRNADVIRRGASRRAL